jgi:hypothetical protein
MSIVAGSRHASIINIVKAKAITLKSKLHRNYHPKLTLKSIDDPILDSLTLVQLKIFITADSKGQFIGLVKVILSNEFEKRDLA